MTAQTTRSLDGHLRSALVTGASRGIGLAIARRLAARGFGLTITARDQDRLHGVADELIAQGSPQVVPIAGDLAIEDFPATIAQAHQDAFGSMTALILNAGVGTAGDIATYPARRLDKMVAVNLRAPFLVLQHSLPGLRTWAATAPDHGARVVALSSITGVYPEAGLAAYGATKAAVASLIDTLNAEEGGRGVCGTSVCPAYVDTDMSSWAHDLVPAAEMIPAEDIATLVDTLVSLSRRTTVQRLVVSRTGASPFIA